MELLERKPQLSALKAALADAASGSGRVALVSGEAGIGKTALVEQFCGARQESIRLLWGVCDSLFTPRPLGPLHDMVDQLRGGIPELLTADLNRTQLFTSFLSELKHQPTIAVFEDVQWADEATLDLLRYLGRRISQTTALLVMTYRDDELGARHPLLTVLGDIGASNATQRIPLSPLSENAVSKLVKDLGMDAAALHRQTGGNPFYINEVLASTDGGIPASIRDAVLARTARLSLSGLAVVEAAAVIGMRIEPWLLDVVTGSEVTAADEGIEAGILLPQGDALVFRHDLTRQTILELISPQRRPVLHRLVLDALKSSPLNPKDLARLAHHAEASGDYQSVLEYAPAAAHQASAAGAHREAAALYALVLRYAEHLEPSVHASTLQDYARECNVTEKQTQAIAAQRKAAQVWEQLSETSRQAGTLATLAVMLRNHGENASAEETNRTAIMMLEAETPGRELALAYRVQATLSLSNRNYAEAIEWGEKAIALAKDFEDKAVPAIAQVAVGSAWLFLNYEFGCQLLEKHLQMLMESGDERHIANLYAYIGSCSVELYRFREAERYLAQGLAFTAERSLDIFSRYMLAWQVLARIHLGRWEEASQVSSMLMQNPTYPAISRITALAAAGRLQCRQGEAGGNAVLNEALDMAEQTGTLQYLGLVRSVRAEAAWLAGDQAAAASEARAAFALAESKQHPWFTGELAYWRWKTGETPHLPPWVAKPFALQITGEWQQAAAEWEQMGCPYEQARALSEGDSEAMLSALRIFERFGAHPAAEALRQQLQSAGVPQQPPTPRSSTRQNPFGLTNRQTEILALLIEDLSNPQIAASLHISPKTVDHHVSAILTRLDVHSRADAAQLARQHPHFQNK